MNANEKKVNERKRIEKKKSDENELKEKKKSKTNELKEKKSKINEVKEKKSEVNVKKNDKENYQGEIEDDGSEENDQGKVKDKCGQCSLYFKGGHLAIECDWFNKWLHLLFRLYRVDSTNFLCV